MASLNQENTKEWTVLGSFMNYLAQEFYNASNHQPLKTEERNEQIPVSQPPDYMHTSYNPSINFTNDSQNLYKKDKEWTVVGSLADYAPNTTYSPRYNNFNLDCCNLNLDELIRLNDSDLFKLANFTGYLDEGVLGQIIVPESSKPDVRTGMPQKLTRGVIIHEFVHRKFPHFNETQVRMLVPTLFSEVGDMETAHEMQKFIPTY